MLDIISLLELNTIEKYLNFCATLCLNEQIKYAVCLCVLDFFYLLKEKHCRSPPSCQFKNFELIGEIENGR